MQGAASPKPCVDVSALHVDSAKTSYSLVFGRRLVLVQVPLSEQASLWACFANATPKYDVSFCEDAAAWLLDSDLQPDIIVKYEARQDLSVHQGTNGTSGRRTSRRKLGVLTPLMLVVDDSLEVHEVVARVEAIVRGIDTAWWHAPHSEADSELLRNILPRTALRRLRAGESRVSERHAHVTILFSDIVGFTEMAAGMPMEHVFGLLHGLFMAFDRLTDRHSVYKVETIGDGYMVAAGHDAEVEEEATRSAALRVLDMAIDMLVAVRNLPWKNDSKRIAIRLGVHCGPAMAGIIGFKCPRYCFVGDTVNTASRMETSGSPMRIHVSEAFVAATGSPRLFEDAGMQNIKGKGAMRTYFVKEAHAFTMYRIGSLNCGSTSNNAMSQEPSSKGAKLKERLSF